MKLLLLVVVFLGFNAQASNGGPLSFKDDSGKTAFDTIKALYNSAGPASLKNFPSYYSKSLNMECAAVAQGAPNHVVSSLVPVLVKDVVMQRSGSEVKSDIILGFDASQWRGPYSNDYLMSEDTKSFRFLTSTSTDLIEGFETDDVMTMTSSRFRDGLLISSGIIVSHKTDDVVNVMTYCWTN